MTKVVVDASFLLNAIELRSPDAHERLLSFGKAKVLVSAPAILVSEMANALRFSYKALEREHAERVFSFFESLTIEYKELDTSFIRRCLTISYDTNTSVYDTSYHVLALDLDATFLTCDKQYFDRANHLGNIELLSTN